MKIEYNNLYTHFIFTTLHRTPIIPEKNRQRIEKFITGVVKNYGCKLYAIYANPEHIHFLISRSPSISEEYIANIVADSSSKFINENKLAQEKFAWQENSSAFSVSKRDIDKVCKYILNQKKHHRKVTFKSLIPQLSNFLLSTLQLTLHPKKIYLQSVEKGVQFLGAIIKPHRNYLKNRTKGNFIKTIKHWNNVVEDKLDKQLTLQETKQFVSSVNSYLGIGKHYATYKMRGEIIRKNMNHNLWKNVYLYGREKLKIKKSIKNTENKNLQLCN